MLGDGEESLGDAWGCLGMAGDICRWLRMLAIACDCLGILGNN